MKTYLSPLRIWLTIFINVIVALFALHTVLGQTSDVCQVTLESVKTFDWHLDGETLMFGSNCGVIGFDAEMAERVAYLPLDRVFELNSVAYNSDGTLLAISRNYIGISVGEVLIWNTQSRQIIREFQDSYSQSPLVWHPTENVLMIGNWAEPRLVSADSDEIINRFPIPDWQTYSREPRWFVHLACWLPDGSEVRVFVSQHMFMLTYPEWELASDEQMQQGSFRGADCNRQVTHIALPNTQILDLDTNRLTTPETPCTGISAAWNPNGETEFAVNCDDRTVRIYGSEGELLRTLEGDFHSGSASGLQHSIRYSPDGRQLAALGDSGQFRIWDTITYNLVTHVNIAELANSHPR